MVREVAPSGSHMEVENAGYERGAQRVYVNAPIGRLSPGGSYSEYFVVAPGGRLSREGFFVGCAQWTTFP